MQEGKALVFFDGMMLKIGITQLSINYDMDMIRGIDVSGHILEEKSGAKDPVEEWFESLSQDEKKKLIKEYI